MKGPSANVPPDEDPYEGVMPRGPRAEMSEALRKVTGHPSFNPITVEREVAARLMDRKRSEGAMGANSWTPWQGSAALLEIDEGLVIRVGEKSFDPTADTRVAGALCFAYGLDNALFSTAHTPPLSVRWLVWHYCALVSRQDGPDVARLAEEGLNGALALAGPAAAEIEALFKARLALVRDAASNRLSL